MKFSPATVAIGLLMPAMLLVACEGNPESSLRRIGGQGTTDFVVADPALARDPALLEQQVKQFCNGKGGGFCEILVWTNSSTAARSFPMSDSEMKSQFAQYNRNKNTGYDCFSLLKDGSIVEKSGRC